VCDHCSAWLHCCAACQHYAPGKPNDCAIPDTDPIADREACNYCDEYAMAGLPDEKHRNATDVAEGLFGEKPEGFSNKEPKDRFKDLFDD
jgi:hypothetical protein